MLAAAVERLLSPLLLHAQTPAEAAAATAVAAADADAVFEGAALLTTTPVRCRLARLAPCCCRCCCADVRACPSPGGSSSPTHGCLALGAGHQTPHAPSCKHHQQTSSDILVS